MLHSRESMRAVYGHGHPICPINKIFKHADSKRMWRIQLGELNPVSAIPIARFNDIQLGIDPEQPLGDVTEGQPVGPSYELAGYEPVSP